MATAPLRAMVAAAPATAVARLTALPAPEEPVIPPEAAIPAAEATAKSQTRQQGVVNEVKVRGGKGVLNGTPFLIWYDATLPLASRPPDTSGGRAR